MDKNEYNLKLEEIDRYISQGMFSEAAKVADTIDWRRVRNVRTLCMISEVYEADGRYEDSKALLLRAYRRSPVGRGILYRLVEVTIALKQFDEAIEYYSEYVQAAPHDNNKYILKYKIYKGRGSSVEEQIAILKEYLEQEYTEKWVYELAKLYQQSGKIQECLATCDDLVLWFHSGKYVIKALELKRRYAALTPKQQEIYDHRFDEPEEDEYIGESLLGSEKQIVKTNTDIADTIVADTEKAIAEAVGEAVGEAAAQGVPAGMTDVSGIGAAAETAGEAAEEAAGAAAETAETVGEAVEDETAEAAAETAGEAVSAAAETVSETAETAAETAGEAVSAVAETVGETAEAAAETAGEAVSAAAETVSETAEAAAETAEEAVSAAAETVGETAEAAAEAAAETVSETAEAAAEAAETAAEAAGEAGEAAEAAGEAAGAASGALTYDADSIHSDMVKSMREIVAGVIRTPEVSEDAAAADAVIEESRAQLAARSEGESGIRIPQQQGRVQAGKLSIDDILLSMGDRGTEVREAAAKATGAGRAQEEGQETGTAPAGVVSAIDEALMGMGVERRTPLSADEKKKPAAGTGSGEDDLLPGEEIAQRAEAEAAAKKKAAEEAAAAAAALQDGEEAAAAAASVKAAFAGEGEEAAGEQASQEEEEEREAILTAKTRVLPTEEIAARYARRPLRLEEEETAAGETAAQETAPAAEEEAAEEAFGEEGAGEAEAYGEAAEETLTEEGEAAGEGEEEAGEAGETPEETEGQTGSGLRVRDSQRGLFRGFLEIGSLDEQIAAAIMNAGNKGQDRTSRTGNILIFGDHGCGKTTIATGIAKAIAMDRGAQYLKMARIYAADLNRKDIPATIAKIAGGILIIEEAGDLDDAIVDQLTTAMEFRTDGMIMILEDERRYIHDKLMRHPRFTMKFTSQIYIPAFTIDELVRFGEIYALSKDYSLSDGAAAALYERIGSVSMQGDAVSITNVIELVDRAIGKASGFMRKLAGKKRYDENDCVILLEKDFRK